MSDYARSGCSCAPRIWLTVGRVCRRGYAEKGLRTVTSDSHHIRGERFSVIPLLSATKVLDYIIVKHTGVADIFLRYIKAAATQQQLNSTAASAAAATQQQQ